MLVRQLAKCSRAKIVSERCFQKGCMRPGPLCTWYSLVRSRTTKEEDLDLMLTYGKELRKSIQAAMQSHNKVYDTKAVKHHVILHYPALVRMYGSMIYQSCEMWDSAHKYMIKAHLSSHGKNSLQKAVEERVCTNFLVVIFT